MQVDVEKLDGQLRKVLVKYDASEINKETGIEARELAKEVRIPGGYTKLTAKIARVKQIPAMRERILYNTLERLVQSAAENISSTGFKAIGRPELQEVPELKSFNQELVVTFHVDEKPEPETLSYKDLDLPELTAVEVTDEDVNQMIEQEIDHLTNYVEASEGYLYLKDDLVFVEVETFIGEEKIELEETTAAVKVGHDVDRGPAFTRIIAMNLTGKKNGDEADLDFSWPEGENQPEAVAGKDVRLHYRVKFGRCQNRPALDEEFVQKVSPKTTVEEYREFIRGKVETTKKEEQRKALMEKVIDLLIQANPMPVPEHTVSKQVEERLEQIQKRDKKAEAPTEEKKAEIREEIIRDLNKTILIAAIADQENLSPDIDAAIQQAEQIAGSLSQGGGGDERMYNNMVYSAFNYLTAQDIERQIFERLYALKNGEVFETPAPADLEQAVESEANADQ